MDKIYMDKNGIAWTTRKMNKSFSYNSCGKPFTKPVHTPMDNLDIIEQEARKKKLI